MVETVRPVKKLVLNVFLAWFAFNNGVERFDPAVKDRMELGELKLGSAQIGGVRRRANELHLDLRLFVEPGGHNRVETGLAALGRAR
jgi:hypothetical protein